MLQYSSVFKITLRGNGQYLRPDKHNMKRKELYQIFTSKSLFMI